MMSLLEKKWRKRQIKRKKHIRNRQLNEIKGRKWQGWSKTRGKKEMKKMKDWKEENAEMNNFENKETFVI